MIWKPLAECQQCHKTVRIKSMFRIMERKNYKLTGRQIDLCPECTLKMTKWELKNSDTTWDKGRAVDNLKDKIDNLDNEY